MTEGRKEGCRRCRISKPKRHRNRRTGDVKIRQFELEVEVPHGPDVVGSMPDVRCVRLGI